MPGHVGVVAGLPGIDAGLLAVNEQRDNALVREPLEHVLVVLPVEMRIPIKRVAAHDEAGDLVLTESDYGQALRGGGLSRR